MSLMFAPRIGIESQRYLQGANILWDGNSISTEDYAVGAGIPRQLQHCLGMRGVNTIVNGYDGVSGLLPIPVSGQSTRNMIGDRVTGVPTIAVGEASIEIDNRLSATRTNVCIVFELTNDLFYYGTGEANRIELCRDNMRNYCKLRKSAGWYVVVMGGTPRGNGYNPGGTTNPALYESDSIALDARIEATYQEFADLFFHTRKLIPEFNQSTLPLYCPGDGVHPLAYGCGIIASRLADFLVQNMRID
jgi:lysophospholipase L1-like esterase